MLETLAPVKMPPGLMRNGTKYQASGRWYDANLVRFLDGTIGPVGGWQRAHNDDGSEVAALTGVPRRAAAWRTETGDTFVGIATTTGLSVFAGGAMHDVTPAGFVPGDGSTAPDSGNGTYNFGPYGAGNYGGGSLAAQLSDAMTWQLDTFGQYLLGVATGDGKLYVWEGDAATHAHAVAGAPTNNRGVVCTPERFVVVLGADNNVRRVYWANQEGFIDWDIESTTNTAGDFELTTEGRLMCGRRTKGQTLLFTDADVHTMTYIGGPLIYRFDQVGDHCGIVAPNAVAVLDAQAMWMGHNNFFAYDGFVKPIPCEVRDYVFGDFNQTQAVKIWATSVAEYGEIWWFYPSAAAEECDRYVVYNYREGHWTTGHLSRTAGVDAGATAYPLLLSPSGVLYEHEILHERDGAVPYLESGPIELGGGDFVMKIQRIVPDERTLGDLSVKLYTAMFPVDDPAPVVPLDNPAGTIETLNGPYTLRSPTSVRLSARQVRVRVDEAHAGSDWRLGTIRLGLIQGGRR